MNKDQSLHLEEAMSPYATPFVEKKELERRYGVNFLDMELSNTRNANS
jgi:hypothetical protein